MALKGAAIWVCARTSYSDLGASDLGPRNSGSAFSLRFDLEKFRKWECCSLAVLAQRAITPVEDEKPHVSEVESSGAIEPTQDNESRGFHKDLNLLPSEFNSISHPFRIESSSLLTAICLIFIIRWRILNGSLFANQALLEFIY
jgi:arogenate/prephenate dehydratase